MKLRVREGSIRLRLTRTEVAALALGDAIEEIVRFSESAHLTYRLKLAREAGARFEGSIITVAIPESEGRAWASGSEVAFKFTQASGLYVLIEKDFTCLKPREHQHEDESDLFPNPNEAHGRCGGP